MMNDRIIAIRNGKLITIDELREDEFGIDCNCFCMKCNKPLVAVRQGKRRSYFRHKMNEEHCHYSADDSLMQYIWQVLESNDIVDKLNISFEKQQFFKIIQKHKKVEKEDLSQENKNKIYIKSINKDSNRFILVIDDLEYIIKLYFNKGDINEIDKNTITINIKDLIKNEETKFNHDSIIKNLLEQIDNSDTIEMNRDKEMEDISTQEIVEKINANVEQKDNKEYFNSIDEEEQHIETIEKDIYKGVEYKIKETDLLCPKCKNKLSFYKARVGTTYICGHCGFRPGM